MSLRIGLVHATLAAVAPMVTAFRERAPSVTLLHFLDEGLLESVKRDGLTPALAAEFTRLVRRAADSSVDGILLTCSAFSPLAAELRTQIPVPLLGADEAMLQHAVRLGSRIGVIATVEAAGPTTLELLNQAAAAADRTVTTQLALIPEAFAALRAGDVAQHDRLIADQAAALAPTNDVLVLAQISMARAAPALANLPVPVLTSPAAGIDALLARLTPLSAPAP